MLFTILDIVGKASAMLALAAVAAVFLRGSSASARHFVWSLGLVGALAAPALAMVLPRWELAIITVPATAVPAPLTAAPQSSTNPVSQSPRAAARPTVTANGASALVPRSAPADTSRNDSQAAISWRVVVLSIWALGAMVIIARVLLGLVAVAWMARRTPDASDASWAVVARRLASDLGICRVRFLRTPAAAMPMAWGLLRPSVLMPADADTWPADRLRVVLLHELAHVKRRDCLTHLFAQVACAAYWFNPLVWVAARHLRAERERACDDLVLAAGTRGSEYADQLLDIARVMRAGRFPAVLAGASLAMAHRSQLEGRLMAILDPTVPRRSIGRTRAAVAVTTFTLLTIPVATVKPWAEAALPTTTTGMTDRVLPLPPAQQATSTAVQTRTDEHTRTRAIPAGSGLGGAVTSAIAQGALEGIAEGVAEGVRQGVGQGVSLGVGQSVGQGVGRGVGQGVSEGVGDGQSGKHQRDPRAVAALIEALKDSDKDVRETAMAALADVRDPRVFEPLMGALHDASPDLREKAAFGLGRLRDKRAVEPLSAILTKDENASVREQAAFALGQIRSAEAVDPLISALHDKNADVREQAAFALGQFRDQRSVDPLISLLKDEDADVREQAAFALAGLRNPKSVEPLVVALKDTKPNVREQVAFALGQLRDPRAIDGLTLALKDPNPSVRQQAAFALGQIR